jgi:hypothetical protein
MEGLKVIDGLNFARRVSLKGELGVDRAHARAVVHHSDERTARLLNVNFDAGRAGIKGILDEFLHHAARAFDDLTSSNLVYGVAVKSADSRFHRSIVDESMPKGMEELLGSADDSRGKVSLVGCSEADMLETGRQCLF